MIILSRKKKTRKRKNLSSCRFVNDSLRILKRGSVRCGLVGGGRESRRGLKRPLALLLEFFVFSRKKKRVETIFTKKKRELLSHFFLFFSLTEPIQGGAEGDAILFSK